MAGRFSVEAVFKALDGFSRPIAKMESNLSKFTKSARAGLSGLNSATDKVIDGLKTAAIAASALGVAAGVALANIGRTGMEFDQAMANVGAVSLMTRAEVADLEKEARRLGLTTKFSATEVANGMELMGKAGFTNAEIIQGIGGILSAAAAEGAEFAETAGNISNVLKGMGLATSETGRVADVLTLASARTNSSITSLGESMKNLAPVARQFNIPLEQAVGSVALLQDVGMDASEAGTAMATMLTKLAKPTDDVAAKMKQFGITFQDAKGNMLPLDQVLQNFAKASQKAGGNMSQVAFFADLVGLRGQKAALNLQDLFKSGKASALFSELIDKAAGSAKKMADIRMDTFQGDLKLLSNAADDLKITLFDLSGAGLRRVVQQTTAWIGANKSLIRDNVKGFLVAFTAYLPLIWIWMKRIGVGIGVFFVFAAILKVVTAGTYLFQGALAVASVATTGLSAAMRILAAITSWSNIVLVASTAHTWLKIAAMAAYNAVTFVGSVAQGLFFLATGRSTAGTVIGTAVTWLSVAARAAWAAITGVASAAMAIFTAESLAGAAATGALTVASWLVTAAMTAFNFILSVNPLFLIGAVILAVIAYLIKLAGGWDYVGAAISRFAKSALSYIEPVVSKVKDLFGWVGKVAGGLSSFAELAPVTPGTGVLNPVDQGQGPQVVPPQMALSPQDQQLMSQFGVGELTVKAEPGTKANVTKQPKSGFGINLQPSGAF